MRLRLLFLLALLAALTIATLNIIKGRTDENIFTYLTPTNFTPKTFQRLVEKEISAPAPLRRLLNKPGSTLTIQGIIIETNKHRAEANLPALQANSLLNQAAQNKLNDMVAKQYFDHISPDGVGPAEIVDGVGYTYVRVGENLALGSFAGDADLVQSWMDSPGHRANIISSGFGELGVAAGLGTFEGKPAWFAVQTFGLPLTACPTTNPILQSSFQQKKSQIEQLEVELKNPPTTYADLAEQGRAKIEQGNDLIKQGNELAQQQKSNDQAQALWDQGEQLQKEGQNLIDQAQAERNAYNDKVTTFNQLNKEATSLVDQINAQIRVYNDCVSSF